MAAGWIPAMFGISLVVLLPEPIAAGRAGHPGLPDQIGARVRTNDKASASLLEEGLRRSSIIRKLVADIQTSDVLVMLAASNDRTMRGLTQLTSAEGGFRTLITRITTFLNQDERIAVLGHELQHVCEIAAAPEVTDQASLRRLFDRIGKRRDWSGDRYETVAAMEAERRVLDELRRAR